LSPRRKTTRWERRHGIDEVKAQEKAFGKRKRKRKDLRKAEKAGEGGGA